MQDLVGGDNNRTPVKCQGTDNCNIVGDVTTPELKTLPVIFKPNPK
jgi:hypothetical protein